MFVNIGMNPIFIDRKAIKTDTIGATAIGINNNLVGKWQGAVTQVLAVAASVVIYYPFVKALDRQYQKEGHHRMIHFFHSFFHFTANIFIILNMHFLHSSFSTMFLVLHGLLLWQGAVTQVLAVAASVVIYYPFVKALDRQYQKEEWIINNDTSGNS
jgi:cellobiose-specific phosphotransferase system component IIC